MSEPKLNPKHIRAMKDNKAPLEYLVSSADAGEARVLKSGADKYGIRNWLIDRILATTYVAAIRRHVNEWAAGSDEDKDSEEHPLSHVRACCAIVMDAEKNGQLIDDRLRRESIDQEQAKQSLFVEPEFLYTVMYTSIQKGENHMPLARTKSFGPFASVDECGDFIRDNPRGAIGVASISQVIII